VPSPAASLQVTSTLLARKKARHHRYPSSTVTCSLSVGWAPSTFVSSRSDRAKQKASRAEDYMDEEDLAELRESQIMAGVKEQQQHDVFGAAHPEPTQGDPEQE